MKSSRAVFLATSLSLVCAAGPAFAQQPLGDAAPASVSGPGLQTSSAFKDLFAPLGGDLKRVVTTPQNLVIFGIGGATALVANQADQHVASTKWSSMMREGFAPAQY